MSSASKIKKVISEFKLPEGIKPIEPNQGYWVELIDFIKPKGSREVTEVTLRYNPVTKESVVVSVASIGNVSADMLLAKIEKQGVERYKLYRKI